MELVSITLNVTICNSKDIENKEIKTNGEQFVDKLRNRYVLWYIRKRNEIDEI